MQYVRNVWIPVHIPFVTELIISFLITNHFDVKRRMWISFFAVLCSLGFHFHLVNTANNNPATGPLPSVGGFCDASLCFKCRSGVASRGSSFVCQTILQFLVNVVCCSSALNSEDVRIVVMFVPQSYLTLVQWVTEEWKVLLRTGRSSELCTGVKRLLEKLTLLHRSTRYNYFMFHYKSWFRHCL